MPGESSLGRIWLAELLKRSPPLLPLLAMLEFIRLLLVALAGDLKLLSFVAFRVFPFDFFFSSLLR